MTKIIGKLTEQEKQKIWKAIQENQASDDRDPQEVIATKYHGDEETYLKDMANWHGVLI